MPTPNTLLSLFVPPDGFCLVSCVATTFRIDWPFFEEDLLPVALGLRAPVGRIPAFRSELRRALERCAISVLYDPRGCDRPGHPPHVDPIVISRTAKQHAKITCLLWSGPGDEPEQRLRLIVGSANLTSSGFRNNYEVVSALDYGAKAKAPGALLQAALAYVRTLADEFLAIPRSVREPLRLAKQLADMDAFAARLPEGESDEESPWRFVTATDVVARLVEAWSAWGESRPQCIRLVSPFWPQGDEPYRPLVDLVQRFGVPDRLELICDGVSGAGTIRTPVLPPELAGNLRRHLGCTLVIRPAQADFGTKEQQNDVGDATEDDDLAPARPGLSIAERSLHAKLIVVEGEQGSVLYCGSSNLTRRGLNLGGRPNHEAGWIFRLGKRAAKNMLAPLLAFAGPPQEVLPDGAEPAVKPPEQVVDNPFPAFLQEIVSDGETLTIRFCTGTVPSDLMILLDGKVVLDAAAHGPPANPYVVLLKDCLALAGGPTAAMPAAPVLKPQPATFAMVRWHGHEALFPLRFDDKDALPRILFGRQPTEAELIDYFLLGRVPEEESTTYQPGDQPVDSEGRPVDTSRILAYFMRRFVQALPGLEAELAAATRARAPLRSALFGLTSPVALAQEAYASLNRNPGAHEPKKTPTAVGFQLVEIIAALRRGRECVSEADQRATYEEAIGKCCAWLNATRAAHPALRQPEFSNYCRLFAEDR